METEIWKDIPGYPLYQASNLGRIRSLKRGKTTVLKISIHKDGYKQICLCVKGKRMSRKIHQLIAIAFLDHVPNGRKNVVDHIDSDVTNNKVSNLRIVTMRENTSKERTAKSGLPVGVSVKRKKYAAKIYINGKSKNLGVFLTPQEASEAYQAALKELN